MACVARNDKVSLYGFVFFRDRAYISIVIEDRRSLKVEEAYGDHDGKVNE